MQISHRMTSNYSHRPIYNSQSETITGKQNEPVDVLCIFKGSILRKMFVLEMCLGFFERCSSWRGVYFGVHGVLRKVSFLGRSLFWRGAHLRFVSFER